MNYRYVFCKVRVTLDLDVSTLDLYVGIVDLYVGMVDLDVGMVDLWTYGATLRVEVC